MLTNKIENRYKINFFSTTRDDIINFDIKNEILQNIFKIVDFSKMFYNLSENLRKILI